MPFSRSFLLLVGVLAACCMVSLNAESPAATPVKSAVARKPVAGKSVSRPGVSAKSATKPAKAKKPGATSRTASAAKPAAPLDPNAFIPIYNQGRDAFKAQRYEDAEKPLKTSLAMAERLYAAKPDASRLKNVAIISQLTGVNAFRLKKYGEATRFMKRSLEIYSRAEYQAENQDSIAGALLNLGQISLYEGRYGEAEGYLKTALPKAERVYGPEHEQTRQTRTYLEDLAKIDYSPDYVQSMGQKVTRWTHPEQPILVYLQDGSQISGWKAQNQNIVRAAYTEWQQAMGDRVHFAFVDDPQLADTIVSWMPTPKESTHEGKPGEHELHNGECQTQISNTTLFKDDLSIAVRNTDGKIFSDNVLYNTLLHEIGHSLGLLGGHSTNPSDVMFASDRYNDGRLKHLSARDVNTIASLYALPADISPPVGIHLVSYAQYVNLYNQGAQAFNAKNYQLAASNFYNAMSIYRQDLDSRFWVGMCQYQLKAYPDALPYFTAASSVPGQFQAEALKMSGYALIKSGEADDKMGANAIAEQKYQQAYQVLTQGLQRISVQPETDKAIQDELVWINQRLAMRNGGAPIRWASSSQTADAGQSSAQPDGGKKKKKWWSSFFDISSTTPMTVPIMMPYYMRGY